ncbi:MAG: alpha-hydroxy-acid oxidizing protein [Acidimicrobiaceae bacterium]|nr:alpha-hydroxy-acid oxidizing protein [Acidimicrobiaceae bacterium]
MSLAEYQRIRDAAAANDSLYHGGRQLDGAPAPIDLVAPSRDAVGDSIDIIADGGVRRRLKNFRSSRLLSRLEQVVSIERGRNGHYRGVGTQEASTGILELRQFDSQQAEGGRIANWVDGLLAEGLPSEEVMPQESRQILPEEIAVLTRHADSLDPVSEALTDRSIDIARAHSVHKMRVNLRDWRAADCVRDALAGAVPHSRIQESAPFSLVFCALVQTFR